MRYVMAQKSDEVRNGFIPCASLICSICTLLDISEGKMV